MTELPPEPPASKLKGCLTIVALFAAFFTIVPFVMNGSLDFFFPHAERQLKMVLANARVTDISRSRQQYTYYLDDNELEGYDFNGYVYANPALRKNMNDTLGYDPSDLGHYLRRNDCLIKAANSPLVTVHRGSIVTHWILSSATPESKVPPPKKYVVMDGDTVMVHGLSELF